MNDRFNEHVVARQGIRERRVRGHAPTFENVRDSVLAALVYRRQGVRVMTLLTKIRKALVSHCYPEIEFGVGRLQFFVLLLRACPQGSRLTFNRDEPASFVVAFREWSHRTDVNSFAADYYTLDNGLVVLAERLVAHSQLELHSHFGIVSSYGQMLCTSWNDFSIVKLADDVLARIRSQLGNRTVRV